MVAHADEVMRRRAELPCRLPPLLSRYRLVLPLEAGMGQVPQSLANAASLRMRSVLSPATMASIVGGHRAGAVKVEQGTGVFLQHESHVLFQQVRLFFESLPCIVQGFQRDEHTLLPYSHSGGIRREYL